MRIGYRLVPLRCYADVELQLDALKRAGCKQLFTDYDVSATEGPRPMLARALEALHRGDEFVIVYRDQLRPRAAQIEAELSGRGVSLNALSEAPHLVRILAG